MQGFHIVLQQLAAAGIGLFHNALDFRIHEPGGFFAVVLVLHPFAADEDFFVLLAHGQRADGLAHAPFADHAPGSPGHTLDVVGCARGVIGKHQLLGHAPAQKHHQRVQQVTAGVAVPILFRQLHGHPQSPAARDDGHLVDGVGTGEQTRRQRMPAFMIGGIALFLVGKHETATFTTHENLVLGIFKVAHVQLFLIQLGSLQSGFIDQVFQIRAGKARRAACQHLQVHIGSQRRALGMHLKNALAAPQIRRRHHHLTVKATGPQQGGIKHVGTVGGRNEDDALVAFKAVHFHQQLIQGLFAFVVSAAQPSAALAAHGVDFVNKNQTGGVLLALNKEIAHAGRAHAHEHFHKVGTGDGEKRHTGFSGHGPGKQGLTCTGRPHKQHALGNAPAQPGKLLGIGKKFDDFGKFVLGFVHTGHVVKGDAAVFLIEHAGPRTAKVHGLAAAPALHLTHEENPHSNQQRHGQQGNKHLHVPGLLFRRLCLDLHLLFHQAGDQFQIAGGVASDRGAVRGFPRQGIALNGDAGNLPAVHAGNKVGIGQLLRRALRLLKHIEHHNQSNGDDAPQQQVSAGLIQDGLPQRLRYPVTFPGERNFSLETSPQRGALSICPYCRSSEHKHAPASGNGRGGISPARRQKRSSRVRGVARERARRCRKGEACSKEQTGISSYSRGRYPVAIRPEQTYGATLLPPSL